MQSQSNKPFSSCFMPRDESEAILYENRFYLNVNENSFSNESLCTKPRLHHEA